MIGIVESFNNNVYERYKEYALEKYKSKSSARSRISAVKKFTEFLNSKGIRVDDADYGVVDEFLKEGSKYVARTTIQNRYSYLESFFKFLKEQHDNEKMDYSKVNFKREKKYNLETYSDDELKELFEIIENDKNRNSNRIIFKILLYTGCTLNELSSIQVFFCKKDVTKEEKFYIALDTKEICLNGSVIYILPESILNDIKEYYDEVKLWYKKELPAKMPLIVCMHTGDEDIRQIKPLKYVSIQDRMTRIKNKSSFKEKNLSLKSFRHTVIKKMLSENNDLVYISNMMRIDLSTLKSYITDQEERNESEKFLKNHPFRNLL